MPNSRSCSKLFRCIANGFQTKSPFFSKTSCPVEDFAQNCHFSALFMSFLVHWRHSFQEIYPRKILLKIVILVHYLRHILSTEDTPSKKSIQCKIVLKIVILIHCGHVQTKLKTFSNYFCLIQHFALNCHFVHSRLSRIKKSLLENL